MIFLVKHCQFAWEIVDFQSSKALPIWRFLDHFSFEKILRSTRTLDCNKYRLKLKGRFSSFCWAIFLYFSTPISWVMIRMSSIPHFWGHLRQWVITKRELVLVMTKCMPFPITNSSKSVWKLKFDWLYITWCCIFNTIIGIMREPVQLSLQWYLWYSICYDYGMYSAAGYEWRSEINFCNLLVLRSRKIHIVFILQWVSTTASTKCKMLFKI